MNKISSSIERINYPRGLISQFRIATSSCGFFPDELKKKKLTMTSRRYSMQGQLKYDCVES